MKTKNLKYNITISTAPAMPKLGKGTECVQLLLSQVSKDMHEPLVPMLFPILGELGERTQYLNLPEVEMADRMCGGHKQISQMLRNIYDRQRAGALRATADGITGNPVLRANLTLSSTPFAARKFYKNELFNGTFGRMVFSYKARQARVGKIPRQGEYDAGFFEKLDEYLVKLSICKGRFIIKPLNSLTDRLAADMATLADLTDDDVLWDISKRSIVSAWKAGCLLWVLNDQTWTKAMGELVEWLVYHDIWSKMQLFADLLNQDADSVSEAQRRGPKNLLDDLPNPFNEAQLESLRLQLGKSKDGTKGQIRKWVFRKFITFSAETGLYTKTEEYLTGSGTSDGIARNGGKSGGSGRKKKEADDGQKEADDGQKEADDGQKEMAADAKKKKGKGI